jgi:hypothetical protein
MVCRADELNAFSVRLDGCSVETRVVTTFNPSEVGVLFAQETVCTGFEQIPVAQRFQTRDDFWVEWIFHAPVIEVLFS